jgi:hypothetical protein
VAFTKQSGDATLSGLAISAGTLNPAFSPAVTSYTVSVPNSVGSVTITASKNHASAAVAGAGAKNLSVGANTAIVTVTAENGTTKSYTIVITREQAAGNNTGTSTGTASGAFTPDGNNRYVVGSNEDLVFIAQNDFALFSHVLVNGVTLIRDVQYKVESGSTIVTLFADYLKTLPTGIQTLTVVFSDSTSVTDNFAITVANSINSPLRYAPTDGPSGTSGIATTAANGAPRTGDGGNVNLWLFLLVLSTIGIVAMAGVIIKRRGRMQ